MQVNLEENHSSVTAQRKGRSLLSVLSMKQETWQQEARAALRLIAALSFQRDASRKTTEGREPRSSLLNVLGTKNANDSPLLVRRAMKASDRLESCGGAGTGELGVFSASSQIHPNISNQSNSHWDMQLLYSSLLTKKQTKKQRKQEGKMSRQTSLPQKKDQPPT